MVAIAANQDDMRKRADWMVPSDDIILELCEEHGNLTPGAITAFGGPSHAGDRCRELASYGLLEQVHRGLYALSEKGQLYLQEELDAADLEQSDVTPRTERV